MGGLIWAIEKRGDEERWKVRGRKTRGAVARKGEVGFGGEVSHGEEGDAMRKDRETLERSPTMKMKKERDEKGTRHYYLSMAIEVLRSHCLYFGSFEGRKEPLVWI